MQIRWSISVSTHIALQTRREPPLNFARSVAPRIIFLERHIKYQVVQLSTSTHNVPRVSCLAWIHVCEFMACVVIFLTVTGLVLPGVSRFAVVQ